MMCHRDDFDLPVTDPIDQTKRKVRKAIPTRSVHIPRPTLRSLSHTFYAGVDFRRKSGCGDGTPLRVPLHRGFYLGSGCRVKSNLDVGHQYAS